MDKHISTPLKVNVPPASGPYVIETDYVEDQSSSESASACRQAQRSHPGNPSDLIASAKRKKSTRGSRTAAILTSFSSRSLKLEDVREKRGGVASSLMEPEVQ